MMRTESGESNSNGKDGLWDYYNDKILPPELDHLDNEYIYSNSCMMSKNYYIC